jgi:HAD superfamily hydrolase (TIGR01549 family)
MIKAVIFDVDGTIVDSNEAHVVAWDRAFRHFGKQFPIDKLRKNVGKGADQYLPEFLSPEELRTLGDKIDKYRSEIFKKEYLPHLRPFPKVRELFQRIKHDEKRIALASSGKKSDLKVMKKIARIEDLVDCEITADDADKSKPAPDIFASTLKKLGDLPADAVLAIGDTPYDAIAARKVGIATIGVLCGGFPETELRAAGMIAIYRDPADLLRHYEDSPIVETRRG